MPTGAALTGCSVCAWPACCKAPSSAMTTAKSCLRRVAARLRGYSAASARFIGSGPVEDEPFYIRADLGQRVGGDFCIQPPCAGACRGRAPPRPKSSFVASLYASRDSLATLAALHGKLWQGSPLAWLLAAGSGILFDGLRLRALCSARLRHLLFIVGRNTLILLERAGGRLPRVALYRRYAAAGAARRRLEIMRENGLLALEGGRYRLTPKAAALARFFAAVKRLWNLQPGG